MLHWLSVGVEQCGVPVAKGFVTFAGVHRDVLAFVLDHGGCFDRFFEDVDVILITLLSSDCELGGVVGPGGWKPPPR